jgi:hypothetical protein
MQGDQEDAVVHLVVPRWLRRELKRAAADSDTTIRELAREALADYVERRRQSACREESRS